ncbi:unnamed protein product [Linum trigynum]|uniref:Growth-regulating factor n=1 Tax=Linum trigynum TaxID=586398 RepID=A0AAV2CZR4_9ROSI
MSSGGGGSGGGTAMGGSGETLMRSAFTVSQWQELEHQALIFKYMMAGLPVPPDLVLPIQKSFDSISHRFFNHPSMGYCSFYGKKVDPEPGRCRRTDGKKWRCSKDAHPDSKYCERHMHRGRNRSRKPVESSQQQQTIMTQSLSTMTPSGRTVITDSSSGGAGSLQHNSALHAFGAFGNPQCTAVSGSNQSQYHLDSIPYAIPSKDYSRYLQGVKAEAGERGIYNEDSARNRGGDSSTWPQMQQSRVLSFSKPATMNDYSHQQSYLGCDFPQSGGETTKQDGQSLRPFFDEWPRTRGESWSGLEDDRSNQTSFSTTQLSMSIPMAASSDMISTSSRSSPSEF